MDIHEKEVDLSFINHLREEKIKQQDRRAAYVKLKFNFVIALFSFSLALKSFEQSIEIRWVNGILYMIPIVSVLFDRYILGGEFAVKRIRAFLKNHDHHEMIWSNFVDEFPKGFMDANRFWVTSCIFVFSIFLTFSNLLRIGANLQDWMIFFFWVLLVSMLCIHLIKIEKMIKKSFKKYPSAIVKTS